MKKISAMILTVLLLFTVTLSFSATDDDPVLNTPGFGDNDNFIFYSGISSIAIVTPPTKSTYQIGDELDLTGLTVRVTYTSGSTIVISSGFAVSGFDSSTAGSKTVTVTVSGKSTTFSVTVNTPVFSRGDVNGDNVINNNDAIYLLHYTLRPSKYPINQSGDMNGDGVVNSNDAIYLLRYVLRPSHYPLAG